MAITSAPPRRVRATWATRRRAAALALALAAAVAFLSAPAYSSYDTIWTLVWGQELLRGEAPSFDAYRAPTEHPLWVALGVLLAPLGETGDRLFVGVSVAAWVALVLGAFRLAAVTMGELVGWLAAALVASRLDYAFLAMRAYVDVAYLALVVWAAALEVQRPRRGGVVWGLVIAAGLLRPEGWLLAGAYALWRGWRGSWSARARELALAAVAPALWMLCDLLATGDPLFSFHHTAETAAALDRSAPAWQIPERVARYLAAIVKPPVLLAAVAGALLAWRFARPRARLRLPAFLALSGAVAFAVLTAAGFTATSRYLALSAVAVTLFAAFALGGWADAPRGRLRAVWIAAAVAGTVLGAAWTVARIDTDRIVWEVRHREALREDLRAALRHPAVVAARRCGPVTVPNHKLAPDVRFLLEAGPGEVVARSTLADAGRRRRGAALFVVGDGDVLMRRAFGPFNNPDDSPLIQVPGPGFERVLVGRYVSAYVRSC